MIEKKEFSVLSSDGVHTLVGVVYLPEGEPRGLFQVVHGMTEHMARYDKFLSDLAEEGYIAFGYDHLGHGKSVNDEGELGYFAKRGGTDFVIADLYEMNKYLHAQYKNLPIFLLGHSMGSFIARIYAVRHPHSIAGLIIHGTAGPNPVLPLGRALAAVTSLFRGDKHRSKFIKSLATGSYNKRFPKEEGINAGLTRKTEAVKDKDNDIRGGFSFTVSGYRDLFRFLGDSNSKKWFDSYPKFLPTLIMSGEADPVGAYGKGPRYVYKKLMISGAERLELKLYEGARHELFNELNADEVFGDLLKWLEASR